MKKQILVIRGNYNQRQLESLNQIWIKLIQTTDKDWLLPLFQITENSDIGVINLEPTGDIILQSLFGETTIENIQDKFGLVNKLVEYLDKDELQKVYEKLHSLGCKIYK
jgi:hypothetical protein